MKTDTCPGTHPWKLLAGTARRLDHERMTKLLFLVAMGLPGLGCAGSATTTQEPARPPAASDAPQAPGATTSDASPASRKNKDVGTALVREIEEWEKTAVVGVDSGEHGLGGMSITVEDIPVWPPQGAGCEQLVRCCNDRVAAKSESALPCLLSVTKNKDCAHALATVNAIGGEQGEPTPASCDPLI